MERRPIAFTIFCAGAGIALVWMIVAGRTLQSRAAHVVAARSAALGARPGEPGPIPMEEPVGVGIPPGYRSTTARNYMRMRLRELTVAEEYYYNETASYTTDISKLQLARRTGDVVVLRVIAAGPAAWSGEATHPALPGKSCVTYAGVATALPSVPQTAVDHTQPLGERDLVCDKP